MRLDLDDIARACRGTLVGADGAPAVVDSVSIDSRHIAPGALFVPLVAERDGHEFLAAARQAGAAAYLTHGPEVGGAHIVVEDTTAALARVGSLARDRLPDAVIGVTGSVGKTTVKDLLAATLSTTYRTTANHRSYNNELGVPLTLSNAADDTEVVVQEMGARGIGHIAVLCAQARPTAAVVTMVAEAHTSEFADLDEVAAAKAELVEAIPPDGFVVLNGSDPRVRAMARLTDARCLTFGVSGDVVAERVELDDELRPRFRLASPWGRADIRLGVHGLHQVANALAAAAAALAQGVPVDALADGLATTALSPWRMEMATTARGAVVINDAYNANPTSMAAALQSLAALGRPRPIAVLGAMAELGPRSDAAHREIGRLARSLHIEVIAVACPAYAVGTDVPDTAAAVAALGAVTDDAAVLVKGSRAADLQGVAEALLAES